MTNQNLTQKERFVFGQWVAADTLTPDSVKKICKQGQKAAEAMADYPLDKVYDVLEKTAASWNNPDYHWRVEAMEVLPRITGFSEPMIAQAMNEISRILDPETLKIKMATELRGIGRGQDYTYDYETGTAKIFEPIGCVLHILSGNVFLAGVGSLLEGLLTGNSTILKMASDEPYFLPVFIKSLLEHDEDKVVCNSIALVDYPSSAKDVIASFQSQVDGIVVWGGEAAVQAYRQNLPARTRLIEFGPKLSFALITEQGLKERGVKEVAENLAMDLSIWDQNACTAPQVCYVQGAEQAQALLQHLGQAMAGMQEVLPAGKVDPNTAIEIQKVRSVAEIAQLKGEGGLETSMNGVDYTLWIDSDLTLEPSPLHRSLKIVSYENIEDVLCEVSPLRGYLQTCGLAYGSREQWDLFKSLRQAGVVRMLPIGTMAGGAIDDPHDGQYDLPQLMNLVFLRTPENMKNVHPLDSLPEQQRQDVCDSRLRNMMKKARLAPMYEDLDLDSVKTTADLASLPILSGDQMREAMPPFSGDLSTQGGQWQGGYVTRSGGSTGDPKFSVYDKSDWEAMISNAARVLRAMGIEKGDRVANCMMAGDLYGGFVSFDHVNHKIGLNSFSLGNSVNADIVLDLWKRFDLNVMQGVPATIVPVLREAKEKDPSFTMEKVIYGGQSLSNNDRLWLKDELGVKILGSIIGANDGGQFAYQCPEMKDGVHHVVDDFNFIEIVDDNGQPVADGESGRILITSLLKEAFPLIRYDIGDKGRFVANSCSCSRKTRSLVFEGRSGDEISAGILNIKHKDFMAAVEPLGASELQIEVYTQGLQECLKIRVELTEGISDPSRVKARFYDAIPLLKSRVDGGQLGAFDVELYPIGQLPRDARSGKVKAIIDIR